MVVGVRDGLLTVIEPMEGTPAFQAGILPSDQIHKIGDTSTLNFELDDAVRLLRGKPGTEVELTIKRPSNQETYVYRLTRSQIKVHKVKDLEGKQDFPLLDGLWAYVRLLQFDEKAGEDLERALGKARQQGGKGAILDLRGNPGGLLDQAVRVCELFLPENQLIVSTEGRIAEENEVYFVAKQGDFQDLPLVILVDHSSASASEIVSGCLQDLSRAVIVGQKTYGKGSVQKILPMPDGSALRLTTSKYYTPSHREIHNKGIWPDIVSRLTEEEEQALYVKRMPGDFERNLEQVLASMDPLRREDFRQLVETVEDHPLEIAKEILMMHARVTIKDPATGDPSLARQP